MASLFASEGLYNVGMTEDPTAVFFAEEEEEESAGGGVSGFRAAMAALYLVVCVAGLTGNGLVMAATLKLDRLGSAATVYIFNLALADGLFMAGLPFVAVQNFRDGWPFGDAACKAVMALDGVNQFTSAFCLTAMSVDRCLALQGGGAGGRWARWRTPRRAKAVAACLWLLSLAPVLPMALRFSAASGLCTVEPPPAAALDAARARAWWGAFLGYAFALGFALPFGVMLVAYGALLAALRRGRRGGAGCRGDGGRYRSPESQRQERQVTRMVVAVVLAFAVCWLPFYALNFCALARSGAGGEGGGGPNFARGFEFVVLFSYSWSCANPVLYACLSATFRAHFRALLCPKTLPPPPSSPRRSPDEEDGDDAVTEGYDLRDDSSEGRSEV